MRAGFFLALIYFVKCGGINMKHNLINKDGVGFITFERFNNMPFIMHGFSTRIGGVSEGEYNSLNLGLKTEDSKNNVGINIEKFASAVGVDYKSLVISDQIHSDVIKVVNREDKGKGYYKERDFNGIDGLVTNIKGIALMTIFADCVPIFFVDPIKKAIGVSHAGWKGTRTKIGKKTVKVMIDEYDSNPKDIIAVIGPSIGKCCYEVDKRVIDEFSSSFEDTSTFISRKEKDKYNLNLWKANHITLEEVGLLNENIVISDICTGCNTDLFYSYRKEHGNTGRMGAIIQLI